MSNLNTENSVTDKPDFATRFKGSFYGVLKWRDLDQLWENVKTQIDDNWYIYVPGQDVPTETTQSTDVIKFITEIDVLLRKEHEKDYCGIVYVDDKAHPSFIKIFDPNNLGVSCGFSDHPPLPGWIMSKLKPCDLNAVTAPTQSRQRWWKQIFS